MTDSKQWLLRWFTQRRPEIAFTWEDHGAEDYFARGWLDSFASLELIEDIEQAFRFKLSEEDLGAQDFATLEGLRRIVDRGRRDTT